MLKAPPSQHPRQHLIWRAVTIGEGLDVDDHFLAHLYPALDGGGAHVRQEDDVGKFAQAGVDFVAVLENVEAGACDFMGAQAASQGVFVDHLAARGVHDHGGGLHQLQAAGVEQVEGRRRMGAVDREDVHPRHHLIKGFPIGGL